jgi:DNA-binding NarL/FixJ family response regulator
MATKIVIVDDSDLMIVGTQAILELDATYRVVGSAQTLNEALRAIELHAPDVVILGDCLYDTDILNAVDTLQAKSQNIVVLVIGGMTDGALIHNLFLHDVKGYLYRSDPLRDCLLLAIRTVLKNRPYLSPTANAEYLITLQSGQTHTSLSSEARTVLNYLTQGISVNQIAHRMGITPRKVYSIRDRLRHRFGVETNEHLISRAVAEGFTTLSNL